MCTSRQLLCAWLLVSALSCGHQQIATDRSAFAFAKANLSSDAAESLEETIGQTLVAHEDCAFPSFLRERIPIPPARWAEIEARDNEYCLGKLGITDLRVESSDLVVLELSREAQGRRPKEVYVVFLRLQAGIWRQSWPTPIGPALH